MTRQLAEVISTCFLQICLESLIRVREAVTNFPARASIFFALFCAWQLACAPALPSPSRLQATAKGAPDRFAEHGVSGSFVLLTPADPTRPASDPVPLIESHGDLPQLRRIPGSTFKIPNTLIGLETGAISPSEVFLWDGKPRAIEGWERDLTLVDAFRVSCVPCYQETARRIGLERMREFVQRLGYGNANVGDVVEAFWLEGPLAISTLEQAQFARRLYLERDLPFRQEDIRLVKEAMKVEETSSYRLFAKTGWVSGSDPNVGWYVGWVETGAGPHFFATRVLVPADKQKLMASVRKSLTLEIMRDLGVIGD